MVPFRGAQAELHRTRTTLPRARLLGAQPDRKIILLICPPVIVLLICGKLRPLIYLVGRPTIRRKTFFESVGSTLLIRSRG